MFKSGIRNRLVASFLVLTGLTLLSLGGYILWFFKNYNIERLTATLKTDAEIAGELLRTRLTEDPPREIDRQIKELGRQIDLRLTLIDVRGAIIADSAEAPSAMENHLGRPEVAAALAGNTGTSVRHSTTVGANFLYVAIPLRDPDGGIGGVVRVSATLAQVEAAYDQIQSFLFGAFLVASLLAVALSFRLARRFTAPLEEMIQVAQQLEEGHLDKRIYLRTGDEAEILARTLNNLASSLDDKLREAVSEKRKLELILQQMDNAVVLMDRYGKVTDANLQARTAFALESAIVGQHNIQVIGSSVLDKSVRETVHENKSRKIEITTGLKDKKRVFQVFLAPIYTSEDAPAGVLGVFHDITALQEMYDRQAEFVANASHELGTPLTAIKGFSETLLDGAMDDPALRVKFIRIIHDEAERMNRLVKDLLQLARLPASEYREHISIEPVLLKPVVEAAVRDLAPLWEEKEQSVTVRIPEEATVMANADWLKAIFINLLDNSVKYTPANGVISVDCQPAGREVTVRVQDSGIGIPAKDLPFIFDRFFRVDRARSRTAGGTGLGLSIVKFLIETLGGKIRVESKPDAGTTFIFTLTSA